MKLLTPILVGTIFFIPTLGLSQKNNTDTLRIQFKEINGKMVLHIEGMAPNDHMYLGVSLYPADYKDPIWDGLHSIIPIKEKGYFTKEIPIDETLRGGYYEVALWEQLVDQKTLYKMAGLLKYRTGQLLPP